MKIFLLILFFLCALVLSYPFLKCYQLSHYTLKKYFKDLSLLRLSFLGKNRVVFTKRMCRFSVVFAIFYAALFCLVFLVVKSPFCIALDAVLLFVFIPIIVALVHLVLLPLESLIKQYYIARARKKFQKSPCKCIAITGSFGKTSTKNILAHMLEKRFKVLLTPGSFNTEMGITKTVLKLDDEDFFIAEMGAKKVGDIKALCRIVRPDYCIVTRVGEQHMESFLSLENIQKTKSEIWLHSSPDALVVVSDSEQGRKIFSSCTRSKFLTGKSGYCSYKNVHLATDCTRFDMTLDGKIYSCKSPLLGGASVENIVAAAAMAHLLGVDGHDIVSAIATLEPAAHRFEVIKSGSLTVLDDSYNSNLRGAEQALEVLSLFAGKKIVVTPGIVEMGAEQSAVNFKLGSLISEVADFVLITSLENKNYLLSGLISHNFPQKNVYFAQKRDQQKNILKVLARGGEVVLFENDLPDNYR